jgi:nucleoside-diphosphate-sugar epimerase
LLAFSAYTVDDDPPGARVAAGARRYARREAPAPHSAVAGAHRGRGAMVAMMTESRARSNRKAKRELGWTPTHPSWRQGFAEVLASDR